MREVGTELKFQYPHRIVGGFKIIPPHMIEPVPEFQYPHRIVGGFKNDVLTGALDQIPSFSILIGSSGGSSEHGGITIRAGSSFSILIGSSGGSSLLAEIDACNDASFSILIGSSGGSSPSADIVAGVNSGFSILIGSSGGSSASRVTPASRYASSFSILIGSSGGSSKVILTQDSAKTKFQYPHRIVGGFKITKQ